MCFVTGLALFALVALATSPANASVCGDASWDLGEFCGRDAFLVTGKTEMNHDCRVYLLDLRLFVNEFAMSGSNLSADINGNGFVDLSDFFPFVASWTGSASPCTRSGMLPDRCEGTIALSFNSDPATIVSTRSQAPNVVERAYVVVAGWTGAELIEYAVEASANVTILNHPPTSYPYWSTAGIPIWCDPDAQHNWRAFIATGGWPTGPVIWTYLDYKVVDSNPAWIKVVPVPSCFGNSRIRWAQAAGNRSFDFATVFNVGINGPAPVGDDTCVPPVPALSPLMLSILAAILLAVAVVVVGRRYSAHA